MVNIPNNNNIINNDVNNINNPTQSVQTPLESFDEDIEVTWTRWKCLVCNYTYEGIKPLKKCPRCGNENPDKFTDAD